MGKVEDIRRYYKQHVNIELYYIISLPYLKLTGMLATTDIEHLLNLTLVPQVYRNIWVSCLHGPFLFYKAIYELFLLGESPHNQWGHLKS